MARPSNRPNDIEPGGYYPGNVAPSAGIPRAGPSNTRELPELPGEGNMATQAMARRQKMEDKNRDPILDLIQAFYDQMNAPFDPNDPYIKSILSNARATTLQSAGNAGVFGPYSQSLAEQAYIKSSAGLQQQRQQMAGNMLGLLTNYKTNKRDFDYQKAKDQYQADLENWRAQEGKNMDLWKMVGGGLGGVGGALLGIPGGPAGIVAGATSGYNLGVNAGGAAYDAFSGGGTNTMPRWNPSGA